MENISLGQLQAVMLFILSLGGSVFALYKALLKGVDKLLKPTNDKIDELSKKIDKTDKNATMNYLVRCMDDLDRNIKLDGASRMRFMEQYEHYTNDLKGNTYIHEEYERLKKEGKL